MKIFKYTNIKIARKQLLTLCKIYSKTKTPLHLNETSCIVYKILCSKCPLGYIGLTFRSLKGRLTFHRSDISRGLPPCARAEHVFHHDYMRTAANQCTDRFNIVRGLRQGYTLSPTFFDLLLESMLKWDSTGINIDGELINHLCFEDDIVLIIDNIQEAQNMLDTINDTSEKVDLKINLSKTQ